MSSSCLAFLGFFWDSLSSKVKEEEWEFVVIKIMDRNIAIVLQKKKYQKLSVKLNLFFFEYTFLYL